MLPSENLNTNLYFIVQECSKRFSTNCRIHSCILYKCSYTVLRPGSIQRTYANNEGYIWIDITRISVVIASNIRLQEPKPLRAFSRLAIHAQL